MLIFFAIVILERDEYAEYNDVIKWFGAVGITPANEGCFISADSDDFVSTEHHLGRPLKAVLDIGRHIIAKRDYDENI